MFSTELPCLSSHGPHVFMVNRFVFLGSLDSREDEEEHSVNASCFSEEDDMLMQHNAVARTEDDSRTEDKIFHDR